MQLRYIEHSEIVGREIVDNGDAHGKTWLAPLHPPSGSPNLREHVVYMLETGGLHLALLFERMLTATTHQIHDGASVLADLAKTSDHWTLTIHGENGASTTDTYPETDIAVRMMRYRAIEEYHRRYPKLTAAEFDDLLNAPSPSDAPYGG